MEDYRGIGDFSGPKKGIGTKPVLIFLGDIWQNDSLHSSIQNLLMDAFRGDRTSKISLQGLDHVLACSSLAGKIYIRLYTINFRKSEGSKVCHLNVQYFELFFEFCVFQIILKKRYQSCRSLQWDRS